ASVNSAGGIQISGQSAFTLVQSSASGTAGNNVFGSGIGNVNVNAPAANTSMTGNAMGALNAVQSAVTLLGSGQGKVGPGENKLQCAVAPASSPTTNYPAAQAGSRDADVAAEAANLTKAQVLQQASTAAMAQANSPPPAVLKLLQQG